MEFMLPASLYLDSWSLEVQYWSRLGTLATLEARGDTQIL